MKFLNGWKTGVGIAGLIVGTVAPHYVPALQGIDTCVQSIFGTLTVLGLIHKGEKAGVLNWAGTSAGNSAAGQ